MKVMMDVCVWRERESDVMVLNILSVSLHFTSCYGCSNDPIFSQWAPFQIDSWVLSIYPSVKFNRFLDIWHNTMPQVHLYIPVPDPKSVKSLRSPGPFMASVFWLHFYSTIMGFNCPLDSILNFFLYFVKDIVLLFSELKMIVDATEPL